MACHPRSILLRTVKRVMCSRRFLSKTNEARKEMNREMNYPIHANTLGRFAGISSMMRLPIQENADGLDACFVGIPFDSGTSYRPGARYSMIKQYKLFVLMYFIVCKRRTYESNPITIMQSRSAPPPPPLPSPLLSPPLLSPPLLSPPLFLDISLLRTMRPVTTITCNAIAPIAVVWDCAKFLPVWRVSMPLGTVVWGINMVGLDLNLVNLGGGHLGYEVWSIRLLVILHSWLELHPSCF